MGPHPVNYDPFCEGGLNGVCNGFSRIRGTYWGTMGSILDWGRFRLALRSQYYFRPYAPHSQRTTKQQLNQGLSRTFMGLVLGGGCMGGGSIELYDSL